jgi:pimeloyl-ACP methyl ester carboxylesterase
MTGSPRHRSVECNGIHLHIAEQGEGPLVILLHGFPEFWYSWRNQIGPIADAGYRVVAADMRGYALSDKPRGVSGYRIDVLADDIAALVRALGEESAAIVGHDWGGVVAWATAIRHPSTISRLVILNAPHPGAMRRAVRSLRQLRRSWYVFAFQLPWIPEMMIRARNLRIIRRLFSTGPVRREAFTDADIERYVDAVRRPATLTSMINYYRAALRYRGRRIAATENVTMPTLILWGMRDEYLGAELIDGLERWVSDLRILRFPEATHWLQHDEPQRVTSAILDFLGRSPA